MPTLEELTDEQRMNLARAGNQLLNSPKTSRKVKKLLMELNPQQWRFPDVEVESTMEEKLAERDKQIDELRNDQIQQAAERRRDKEHDRARARGLDPSDVEKAVVDRKIADWDTAMDFVDLVRQSAAATPAAEESPVKPLIDQKDIWANPEKWAREQSKIAIDELRGRRKRA